MFHICCGKTARSSMFNMGITSLFACRTSVWQNDCHVFATRPRPVSPLLPTWCECTSCNQAMAVKVILQRIVICGKLLFRFLHVSITEAVGWISLGSCSAYAPVLLFCTLQQFHTDIDPLAHQCKVTSVWWGWSSSGFFSSTTDLMTQFQLCYSSSSTWNSIWTHSIISAGSLCSVPLNWRNLTFTSCIHWVNCLTNLPPD